MTARTPAGPTGTDPRALIPGLRYKPGWTFKIGGPLGRYLCVLADTPDSQAPGYRRVTQHMFELPDEPVDAARWLLEQLLRCEQHEACEFFELDGRRPFYPNHQDEGSPYELVDRREQRCP